jgi:hypothetical protein
LADSRKYPDSESTAGTSQYSEPVSFEGHE